MVTGTETSISTDRHWPYLDDCPKDIAINLKFIRKYQKRNDILTLPNHKFI